MIPGAWSASARLKHLPQQLKAYCRAASWEDQVIELAVLKLYQSLHSNNRHTRAQLATQMHTDCEPVRGQDGEHLIHGSGVLALTADAAHSPLKLHTGHPQIATKEFTATWLSTLHAHQTLRGASACKLCVNSAFTCKASNQKLDSLIPIP